MAVSHAESPNGDLATTDKFAHGDAPNDAIPSNSAVEDVPISNNEWHPPPPQHSLDHFDHASPASGRFFLDICAGASRPLSSAIMALKGDTCSFDILLHSDDDLLSDRAYEQLLRLASSGIITYGCGSPACRDYSRLKLRPNIPKALRTPEFLNGVPGLNAAELKRVRDSFCMLNRTVMILTLVFLAGGHVHLEQPQNAMSWLEPIVQSFIRHIALHCVVVAACVYGANWDKAWLFATSWDQLHQMAGLCSHPRGSHENIIGTRASDGSFNSRKTAEYPQPLAKQFADIVIPLLSQQSLDLSLQDTIKFIPTKSLYDFPFSTEDGGGLHSAPDWSSPDRTTDDAFQDLRHSLFDFILSKHLHKEFLANTSKKSPDPPFSETLVDEARQLMTDFLQKRSKPADWTIRAHQPMFLSIMHSLQFLMPNEDVPLFPSLIEGVSAGFHNDIVPSGCFPPNDKPELPSTPLSIHLAKWQSAEKEPATTLALVEEEVRQGWVYKFDGSIGDAKQMCPNVAIGRLGVAFSDSRPPRLVVDSSVCGVNDRCKLPERTNLPSAKDVIRCFPLRNNSHELSGFSLDVKSAHKRVVLRDNEQGLLGFSLNDSLYFYRVCPFGATFSAYWWQRLGGWILRFFHHAVWIPHASWLYVDDYLWLQHRDVLPLVATFLALLCRILNIPISWKKTELDISIHWIGWSFHFSAGYIEIPQDKRTKLLQYIQQLLRHSRIPRTYLEKVIGLIMWMTQLFPFMRIWIRHLYNDLFSIQCTNYSMDPGFWPQLTNCLDDKLCFRRQPDSSAIPIGSTLVSVRHQTISSKSDLHTVQISHRRIWMRIRDPNSDKRILTKSSIRILEMYKHWLEHSSPLVPLRPRPLWSGRSAADAFANSDICGIAGFIQTASHQCLWFSERFTKQDFDALQIPVDDDLQKIISALELLAQIAIVYTVSRLFPGHRVPIRIHSFSDNTGAESGSNKLFTMKHPQCLFVEKLCLLSATFSMELDVQHIAGKNNDEADALSRWNGTDIVPCTCQIDCE